MNTTRVMGGVGVALGGAILLYGFVARPWVSLGVPQIGAIVLASLLCIAGIYFLVKGTATTTPV